MRARLIALALVVAGCGKSAPPPAGAAQRVVSLTPSATEIVAALGATGTLVGVDDYSKFPPEAATLPKVGSFTSPNLEVIVSLKPTLVIVDDIHGQVAGALHDAGIPTVECAIHALPDVEAALRTIGGKLGKAAEAEAVIAGIESAVATTRARRPAKRPRVLAIIDREAGGLGNLVAAGPGSYVDELLAIVGAENVLAASGIRYPKLSMEEVLRGQPEVILDLSFPARQEGVAPWTVDVPAVKTGRVRVLAQEYLIAPSPRVALALDVMAQAIASP